MKKSYFLVIVALLVVLSAIFLRIKARLDDQNALSKTEKSTVSSVAIIDDSATSTLANDSITSYEADEFKETSSQDDLKNINEDDFLITSPKSGDLVSSPLMVGGKISGTWFFEASLPIRLLDSNNNIIAASYATAEGDWMTEELVYFKGQLEFALTATTSDVGYLVVAKDNPSGLPENDGFIKMPVRFR